MGGLGLGDGGRGWPGRAPLQVKTSFPRVTKSKKQPIAATEPLLNELKKGRQLGHTIPGVELQTALMNGGMRP